MKIAIVRMLFTCAIAFAATFSTQAKSFSPPDHYLVEYKLLFTYTQDSLDHFYKQKRIPQVLVPVHNAVDMYEVTYKGLWLDSTFIIAKGVLYVPKVEKPSAEMVYCHGTRISVDQSYGIQDLEQFVCMMHAADGYVAMFPFYYGLGGGEKEHVYQDSWTEAMSTIYMIKACREIYPKIGKSTSGQLFITGYSQGGHAAMATHKMLESGFFPEISLTASSPMSGAYDMVGVQSKTMFQNYNRPHYLPYLLISYQYAYHLWPSDIYGVFKEPYKDELREIFKQPRKLDYGYVDSILPKVPGDMIVDSLVEKFKSDTSFIFTEKLRENGLYNWKPKAPLQMCACYGDDEVMCQNTMETYANMKAKGAPVNERIFGKHLSHNPCAPFAIIYSKTFFDNIRKGKKHYTRVPFFKSLIIHLGIAQANHQAKKHMKHTGKVEDDALAARQKKK